MTDTAKLIRIGWLGLLALSGCAVGPSTGPGSGSVVHAPAASLHAQQSPPPSRMAKTAIEKAIVGLDQPQVESRLGRPTSERARGIARAMEYRDRHCSIEVTLYPEVETRVYRALAYEVTSDDSHQSSHDCLQQFAARMRGR
jgi:hypothetical protein